MTGNGGSDALTQTDYIDVSEPGTPPTADFAGEPTEGVAPLEVAFTNLSTGDYDACTWNFGDGATSTDCSDPQHTYQAADLYTVSLTVSSDGGSTWQAHQILEVDPVSFTGMGVADIWVDPGNPSVIVVGVAGWGGEDDGGGIYRSFDGGYFWTRELDWWTNALAQDPNHPNILYAASERCGYVHQSTDSGQTWDNITPGTEPDECWVWAVNDLAVGAGGDLWAATSIGLMHWDGASWTQVDEVFPGELTAVTLDRTTDPEAIYVGTEGTGVFVSDDAGATWHPLNAGLGSRNITELAISATPNRRLYAATEQGGVWQWQLMGQEERYPIWLPLVLR